MAHREFSLVRGATEAYTGSDLMNDGYTGVLVFLNIDAIDESTVTVTIEGKSPVGTDEYYEILVSAAIASEGLTVLTVHPSVPSETNLAERLPLPVTWRITVAVGGGTQTYDVGYDYIP
jgi:hypothetical protein